MAAKVKIRWNSWPLDPTRVGTEELVDADDATWFVQGGNAVVVGSQQEKDIQAIQKANPEPHKGHDRTETIVTSLPKPPHAKTGE